MNRLNRPPVQPLDLLAPYYAANENVMPGSSTAASRNSSYPLRSGLPFICLTNSSHILNANFGLLTNCNDTKPTPEPSYPVASSYRVCRVSELFDQLVELPDYDPSPSNDKDASRFDSKSTVALPTFPIVAPSSPQPLRAKTRAITPIDITLPSLVSSSHIETTGKLVIDGDNRGESSNVADEATISRKSTVEQETAGSPELAGEGQIRHKLGGVGEAIQDWDGAQDFLEYVEVEAEREQKERDERERLAAQRAQDEAESNIWLMDAFLHGRSLHPPIPPHALPPLQRYSSLRNALGKESSLRPIPPPPAPLPSEQGSSLRGALGVGPIRTEKGSSRRQKYFNPDSRHSSSKGQRRKNEARATRT